jgi:nitrite reductase/ring-hydroxylating ferredoxin subunit
VTIDARFSPVAKDVDVVEGALYGINVGTAAVLLVRLNGTIHALGRICTHEYADLA